MKRFFFFFFLFISTSSFADLYIQTDYRAGTKPNVVTKHHIFLEKPYTVKYELRRYVLILKKVNAKEATLETESYDVDDKGNTAMTGGSYGNYAIGKSKTFVEEGKGNRPKFVFKIFFEKYAPVKN